MRILPQSAQNLPMPAQTLPVLYWSESQQGWWPTVNGRRLRREHYGCGGWLRAVPPGVQAIDIGWVSCDRCAADVAEIQPRRPRTVTREEWAALPVEQGPRRRPTAQRSWPCVDCAATVYRRGSRCTPCLSEFRIETGNIARLVVLLGDGQPAKRTTLARELGITIASLRKIVTRARKAGRPIANDRRGWVRLEVRP